jgi:predicted acyltransferase
LSEATAPAASASPAARETSIDLLRGADVLLMLFVNEVAFVAGAPAFLRHVGTDVDGMTITDVVFPAFLFIVGLALPAAIAARLRREPRPAVLRHVFARAAALVVVGVLMVNAEHGVAGVLSAPVWNIVMTLGVLLVWAAPPAGVAGVPRRWLRAAGVMLLLLAALSYRHSEGSSWFQIRPYWWGILGLIGWAYLGVASLYLWIGEREAQLTGLLGLYGCLTLAGAAGGLGWPTIPGPIMGPIFGTHGAVVLAGVLVGVLLRRHARAGSRPGQVAVRVLGVAAALGAAGLLLHTLNDVHAAFRISKIRATLPWGLVSASLTAALLAFVHWLVNAGAAKRAPRVLLTAGENPLLAYLLAPLLLSVFALTAPLFGGVDPYQALGSTTAVGLARSALFAWVVVVLSGWLRGRGVRFQL